MRLHAPNLLALDFLCMRTSVIVVLLGPVLFGCSNSHAQANDPTSTKMTLRVDSSLVLVDVIAEDTRGALHSRELLTDLQPKDFRVIDNGQEVPIRSVDAAFEITARPISLWLITQCNMGLDPEKTSGFMAGKTHLLMPALSHLNPADLVGVAHWCDDGQSNIDLAPQADPALALKQMEAVLDQPASQVTTRKGELAMQGMIRQILHNRQSEDRARLPVFAFFYGDHSATYPDEADRILSALLETGGIVYGLDQETLDYNPDPQPRNGQTWELVHFYSIATGGDFYSVHRPELLNSALAYVLAQVHHRYVLGFRPTAMDGKRHTLRVELTDAAARRYGKPQLRFRSEYIPLVQSQRQSGR